MQKRKISNKFELRSEVKTFLLNGVNLQRQMEINAWSWDLQNKSSEVL